MVYLGRFVCWRRFGFGAGGGNVGFSFGVLAIEKYDLLRVLPLTKATHGGTGACFNDAIKWGRNRPLDLTVDGYVDVDYTLDTKADIVHIPFLNPARIYDILAHDFRRGAARRPQRPSRSPTIKPSPSFEKRRFPTWRSRWTIPWV